VLTADWGYRVSNGRNWETLWSPIEFKISCCTADGTVVDCCCSVVSADVARVLELLLLLLPWLWREEEDEFLREPFLLEERLVVGDCSGLVGE